MQDYVSEVKDNYRRRLEEERLVLAKNEEELQRMAERRERPSARGYRPLAAPRRSVAEPTAAAPRGAARRARRPSPSRPPRRITNRTHMRCAAAHCGA